MMNFERIKKGYSLHVGINRLAADVKVYEHVEPDAHLRACENDAKAYAQLAAEAGFTKINLLLSESATKETFISTMKSYSKELRSGDLLFLSFSGHGGQIPDTSGDERNDAFDEVWCFHDDLVIDDELRVLWKEFDTGVRILVVSDSCHSGDILMGGESDKRDKRRMFSDMDIGEVEASIQIMAACREDQLTRETHSGEKWHGAFTRRLLDSYYSNRAQRYPQLFDGVKQMTSKTQIPHRETFGRDDSSFFEGLAFKI